MSFAMGRRSAERMNEPVNLICKLTGTSFGVKMQKDKCDVKDNIERED